MAVEPVPGEPAAVADLPDERALLIADYHAGLEVGLRYDGVELRSRADERRESVVDLLDRTDADRLIVLGDLKHAIGGPGGEEREEIETLLEALAVPVTVVKGNHDGDLADLLAERDGVEITPGHGVRLGEVGLVHGHTWPSPDVLAAEVICMGHEHPMIRLEDEVGGARAERAWLRGPLDPAPFSEFHDTDLNADGELVVFPSFNDLTGGTWTNVAGQEFLAPFLPEGFRGAQAYLLDGTRLGEYSRV
ncbi:phosphoesterase [Halorientalis sp. IM1011]|uniref:metallophosphoesterase n=1 Tax=Halorientalis sp. IM1011 TaxID=1932360 RepID=UPI00097CC742|nr:metallophosphoesterase [Halorientalis sp. IM1011]AQL44081.1 phosphoesterase [Halorientalis sp. IM1011]